MELIIRKNLDPDPEYDCHEKKTKRRWTLTEKMQRFKKPLQERGKSYIIITTVDQVYSEALDMLLKSLDWHMDCVIIVYSNAKTDTVTMGTPIRVTTKRNIYEYVGFMIPEWLNLHERDACMLIHDTCKCGKEFSSRATAAFDEHYRNKSDITWLDDKGLCNISIFNRQASRAALRLWRNMMTLSKWTGIYMEVNASHRLSLKGARLRHRYFSDPSRVLGPTVPYSSGVKRNVRYYDCIDLYKYWAVDYIGDHPEKP